MVHRDNRQIQFVVDQLIRERLDTIKILSINAVRAEDFDGDDTIRVTVVVDSPASAFDIGRVSTLVQHLRPRLEAIEEEAFPVISFMSKAEQEAAA